MTLMFSQSPLTRAQREMIAVVVSAANGCEYCQLHHGAALNNYWKNEERVQHLQNNYKAAGLNNRDNLLCRYALELTVQSDDFEGNNKTESSRLAGFDDRAILDAALVVAYFNFVNRLV